MKNTLAITMLLTCAVAAHAQSLLGVTSGNDGKPGEAIESGFDPHRDAPAFDNWGGPGNPGYCMGMAFWTKFFYRRVVWQPGVRDVQRAVRALAEGPVAPFTGKIVVPGFRGYRELSQLAPAQELIKRLVPLGMLRNLGPGVGKSAQPLTDWSRDMEALERFIRSGSPALISATFRDGRPGGHALLAYRVVRHATCTTIHVYDPNLGSRPELWDDATLVYDHRKRTLAYGFNYPEGYTFGFDNFHFVEQENLSTLVIAAFDALRRQGSYRPGARIPAGSSTRASSRKTSS